MAFISHKHQNLVQTLSQTWPLQIQWEGIQKEKKAEHTTEKQLAGLHPKRRKRKKAKWLSGEALQIAEEREVESKGERERYIQLSTEFQRIARKNKGPFNEQCIKLQENNRRGKTRDLFRKTGNIKGTFCPKTGTTEDRNGILYQLSYQGSPVETK